ncbi:MAG TPA: 1-acyl-sn-glycerol-3-phosphate acyltransferase [Anaerolineales bacterium]|nr:1-acyl-sn-glycerol-3-phosphate acyltransferase [Anaerolineales bacterium]
MNYPVYSYPTITIAGLVRDAVLLRRRLFREDACACAARLSPPLRVGGKENIPPGGRYVVTANHYYRPGFNAWWMAIAVSSVIPGDIHWIITGELTFPGKWYAPLGRSLSRFILKRGGCVYGFTTMPPMPPRPHDVEARAAAVRTVLDHVRQTEDPIIGLAPEGGDQAGGRLTRPAPGVGRFGLLLAAQGLRFAPVGVCEAGGELCLRFGAVYDLGVQPGLSSGEKDEQAAQMMMEHIAPLLPSRLRGEFA